LDSNRNLGANRRCAGQQQRSKHGYPNEISHVVSTPYDLADRRIAYYRFKPRPVKIPGEESGPWIRKHSSGRTFAFLLTRL
jgi:hypothetical protein